MSTTDDSALQFPPDDRPLTNEQFRAIVRAARKQHADATLHKQLTDLIAAKLVSAGRTSVAEREVARAASTAAGEKDVARHIENALNLTSEQIEDDVRVGQAWLARHRRDHS